MEKQDYEYIDAVENEWYTHWEPDDDSDPLMCKYVEQVNASDGFDVDYFSDSELCGVIMPVKISKDVEAAANFAVEEFNRLKGAELKLQKIVKCNWILVDGSLYYMTLECWDGRFYEAKVYKPICEDHILEVFRPAKHLQSRLSSSSSSSRGKSEGSSDDGDA